ncbi:MAG: hypothetical protein HY276_03715 [Ignavibacteriales bacterium]|nr:hypothetical protein [Ignavibacteriales bacterium]MBI3787344.1 hypothetical protein [Ignavibacteriales bacterium]
MVEVAKSKEKGDRIQMERRKQDIVFLYRCGAKSLLFLNRFSTFTTTDDAPKGIFPGFEISFTRGDNNLTADTMWQASFKEIKLRGNNRCRNIRKNP